MRDSRLVDTRGGVARKLVSTATSLALAFSLMPAVGLVGAGTDPASTAYADEGDEGQIDISAEDVWINGLWDSKNDCLSHVREHGLEFNVTYHDDESRELVLNEDYEYALQKRNPVEGAEDTWENVSSIEVAGDYKLIVTGIGSFKGTKESTFTVYNDNDLRRYSIQLGNVYVIAPDEGASIELDVQVIDPVTEEPLDADAYTLEYFESGSSGGFSSTVPSAVGEYNVRAAAAGSAFEGYTNSEFFAIVAANDLRAATVEVDGKYLYTPRGEDHYRVVVREGESPTVSVSIGDETLSPDSYSLTWEQRDENWDWSVLESAPSTPGYYRVSANAVEGKTTGSTDASQAQFEIVAPGDIGEAYVRYEDEVFVGSDLELDITAHDVDGYDHTLYEGYDYTVSYKAGGSEEASPDMPSAPGDYTLVITGVNQYAGTSAEREFTIKENPVESFRIVQQAPYEFIEGANGYSTEDGYRYWTPYNSNIFKDGDKLFVRAPGSSVEVVYTYDGGEDFVNEAGEAINLDDFDISIDQDDSTEWALDDGKAVTLPNAFTVSYSGRTCALDARLVPNPVASISFTRNGKSGIELVEGVDGWLSRDEGDSWFEFRCEFQEGDMLTVNRTDGTTERYVYRQEDFANVASGDEFDENWPSMAVEQSYDNQLQDQDNPVATVSYLGKTCEIPITVVKNNVASIAFAPSAPWTVSRADLHWGDQEYCYFREPALKAGDKLTLTYADGSSKDYIYKEPKTGGDWGVFAEEGGTAEISEGDIRFDSPEYDSIEDLPATGDTVSISCMYMGRTCTIDAQVVASPVKGIIYDLASSSVVEGIGIYAYEDEDDDEYWYWYIPQTGDKLTVVTDSGRTTYVYGINDDDELCFESEGGEDIYADDIDFSIDCDSKWEYGQAQNLTVRYAGVETQASVTLAANEVESISLDMGDRAVVQGDAFTLTRYTNGRYRIELNEQFFADGDKLTVHKSGDDGAGTVYVYSTERGGFVNGDNVLQDVKPGSIDSEHGFRERAQWKLGSDSCTIQAQFADVTSAPAPVNVTWNDRAKIEVEFSSSDGVDIAKGSMLDEEDIPDVAKAIYTENDKHMVFAWQSAASGYAYASDNGVHEPTYWTTHPVENPILFKMVGSEQDCEYGDWEVTKEATYDETGIETRACKVCGHSETRETPKKTADRSGLEALVKAANDALADARAEKNVKIAEDGSDIPTTEKWIAQSAIDALASAVASAQAVLDKEDATDEEVENAVSALSAAQAAFNTAQKDGLLQLIDVPAAKTGLVYDGTEQAGVAAGAGYTLANEKGTNAGSYTATATLADGYAWKKDDGSWTKDPVDVEFEIARAKLTATYKSETVEYGDTPALVVEYAGFAEGETEDALTAKPAVATGAKAPGEYKLTPAGGEAANYEFEYVEGTLTIVRNVDTAELEASIASAEAALQGVAASADGTDVSAGGTWVPATVMTAAEAALAEAKAQQEQGTQAQIDAANAALGTATEQLGAAKEATAAIDTARSELAGYAVTDDPSSIGNDTAYITPAQEQAWKDAIAAAVSAVAADNADKAAFESAKSTLEGATGGIKEAAKDQKGQLTAIEVPQAEQNLVYTGEQQAGVKAGKGYTLALKGADTSDANVGIKAAAVETGDAFATDAGTYTVVATLEAGYTWPNSVQNPQEPQEIVFTIAKAKLTATYAGREIKYEEKDAYGPSEDVKVEGFVGNETADSAAGYVAPTVALPSKIEGGETYKLTPAGGEAANYDFGYVEGTLVVGDDPVDVAAAKNVAGQIAALPSSVSTDADQKKVNDAQAAYDKLSAKQKALVDKQAAGSTDKLNSAVKAASKYASDKVAAEKEAADKAAAEKAAAQRAKDAEAAKTFNSATLDAAAVKRASDLGVTELTLGPKVKTVKANAFSGTKIKTLVVKTTKLSKKKVKNSLKGSAVTTVKVQVKALKATKGLKGKKLKAAKKYNKKAKAANKKYVKKYKKIFTKKVAGKKVKVK